LIDPIIAAGTIYNFVKIEIHKLNISVDNSQIAMLENNCFGKKFK